MSDAAELAVGLAGVAAVPSAILRAAVVRLRRSVLLRDIAVRVTFVAVRHRRL